MVGAWKIHTHLKLFKSKLQAFPLAQLKTLNPQGTNNQRLLDDPLYLGLRRKRQGGKAYYDLLDEVMGVI